MSNAEQILSGRGLHKQFGQNVAVDGVDIHVNQGEIVGFLGPNGAGKTTIMNMITGLLDPDEGEVFLFGVKRGAKDPILRSRMAFLQEKPRIYPEMSGRAYLKLFGSIYAVPQIERRIDELLELMSLEQAADRALYTYSRGMQQRICLARTLIHDPDFVVLDEPTLGLDPKGVSEIRDIILELNRKGVALLFSSHQLAEMERICDRIILMNGGKVVAAGPKEDIVRNLSTDLQFTMELAEPSAKIINKLQGQPKVVRVDVVGENGLNVSMHHSECRDLQATRTMLSRAAAAAGGTVLSIEAKSMTLEEAFLALTQRRLN